MSPLLCLKSRDVSLLKSSNRADQLPAGKVVWGAHPVLLAAAGHGAANGIDLCWGAAPYILEHG